MSKKYVFLLISSILISSLGLSQSFDTSQKEDYDIQKFKIIKIHSPKAEHPIELNQINSILVIDNRPDTTYIGFMQKRKPNRIFVGLHTNLKTEFENFFSHSFVLNNDPSSGMLVLIIKKFWFSDEINKEEFDKNQQKEHLTLYRTEDQESDVESGAIVKIEFYYKKQTDYYPLYRFDSIVKIPNTIAENGSFLFQKTITKVLATAFNLLNKNDFLAGKPKLSWSEIDKYNQERFDIPILKVLNYSKGAYASYEEFANNQPSIKNIEIAKDNNGVIQIKDSSTKKSLNLEIWGYCDGKNFFIKSVDNYYLLQRREHAFYIYGMKKTKISQDPLSNRFRNPASEGNLYSSVTANSIANSQKEINYGFYPKPYELDLDNGNLY